MLVKANNEPIRQGEHHAVHINYNRNPSSDAKYVLYIQRDAKERPRARNVWLFKGRAEFVTERVASPWFAGFLPRYDDEIQVSSAAVSTFRWMGRWQPALLTPCVDLDNTFLLPLSLRWQGRDRRKAVFIFLLNVRPPLIKSKLRASEPQ
jgi:hypothetical protein